jgi:hypothetical protein
MVVALAPPYVVDPPALAPPAHGFVVSAQPAPADAYRDDRWQAGIVVRPLGCNEPVVRRYSCTTPPLAPTPIARPGELAFEPVQIQIADSCDSKGYTAANFGPRVRAMVEAATSKAIEKDLWTGSGGTGGFFLRNPVTLTQVVNAPATPGNNPNTQAVSAVDPDVALAALSQALSDCGVGAKGMIHLPAHIAELVAIHLNTEGQRLVTRTRGDVAVVGSGYPGSGPTGHPQATPPAGTAWAYATSGIFNLLLSDTMIFPGTLTEALDRSTNTITYTAERWALVYGNECCTYAVLVNTVPAVSL